MRAKLLALAVVAGALVFGVAGAQQSRIEGIAAVTDGDTLAINGVSIRLDGFDAPERGHRCAGGVNPWTSSKEALRTFIGRRPVSCQIVGHDGRHDRPVGRCSVEGVELGAWMVANGWARDWPRYSCGRYAIAETPAREAQRGLWGMSCPGLWGERDYSTQCPERAHN